MPVRTAISNVNASATNAATTANEVGLPKTQFFTSYFKKHYTLNIIENKQLFWEINCD
jgi:hypothetical protein